MKMCNEMPPKSKYAWNFTFAPNIRFHGVLPKSKFGPLKENVLYTPVFF